MTTETERNGDRPPSKAKILKEISSKRFSWKRTIKAIRKTSKNLKVTSVTSTAILYLYLSFFGIIFDLMFYRKGYGLDPFKYANLEDFIYSVAKHWDVTLTVLLFILAALLMLILLWNAFVAVAWIICYSTPEELPVPSAPERPKYRGLSVAPDDEAGNKTWKKLGADFPKSVSRTATSVGYNLWKSFEFLRAIALYRATQAASRSGNRLIKLYVKMAAVPKGLLTPVKRVLISTAVLVCFVVAPTAGAAFMAQRMEVKSVGEKGTLCKREPIGCEPVSHIGSTGNYAIFRIGEPRETGNGSAQGFEAYWETLKTLFGPTEESERRAQEVQVVPLSNIASFSLRGSASPGNGVTLMDLKDSLDAARKEILGRIDKIDDKQLPNYTSLKELERAIDANSKAILRAIAGIGGDPTGRTPPISLMELKTAFDDSSREILGDIKKIVGEPEKHSTTVNLTNLMVAIEANQSTIREGITTISGRPAEDGANRSPKPISLAELKKNLDDNSREILGRIKKMLGETGDLAKTVDLPQLKLAIEANNSAILEGITTIGGGSVGNPPRPPVNLAKLQTTLDRNASEILARIGTVDDRVTGHSEAAAVAAAKIETSLSEGKGEILARIGMVDDRVADHSQTAAMATGRIEKTLDAGKREILDRVDAVDQHVGDTEDTVVDGTEKIARALDDGKQEILDRIDRFERDRPPNWYDLVTHYIVINRSQTETAEPKVETQHIYALAGFNKGSFVLQKAHRQWLTEFGTALRACGVKRPKIRIIGFSSAEKFSGPIEKIPNMCKPEPDQKEPDESRLNNCFLANHRTSQVVSAILSEIEAPPERLTKADILNLMSGQCSNASNDVQPSNFTFMNVKPWCQLGQMRDARLRIGLDDISSAGIERQPNYLNRGVHVVILDTKNCPGF